MVKYPFLNIVRIAALAVLLASPGVVWAGGDGETDDEVPELPPAAVAGALTLLAGGAVLLKDRLSQGAKRP